MTATVIPLSASMAQAGLASHMDSQSFLGAIRPGDDAKPVEPLEVDLSPVRRKVFMGALEAARKGGAAALDAIKAAAAIAAAMMAWIIRMVAGLARKLGYALLPRQEGGGQALADTSAVQRAAEPRTGTNDVLKAVDPSEGEEVHEGQRAVASTHAGEGRAADPFAALAARSKSGDTSAAGAAQEQILSAATDLADRAVENGTVAKMAENVVRRGLGRVVVDQDMAAEMLEAAREMSAEEQAAVVDVVSQSAAGAPSAGSETAQAAPEVQASAESLLAQVADPNFEALRDEILAVTRRRCLAEAELHEVIRGVTSSVGVPLDRLAWAEMVKEIGGERCRSALEAAQVPIEKVHAAIRSRDDSMAREVQLMMTLGGLEGLVEEHGESPEQIKAAQAMVAKLNAEINQIRVEVLGEEAAEVVPESMVSVASAQASIAQGMEALQQTSAEAEDVVDVARRAPFDKLVHRGG